MYGPQFIIKGINRDGNEVQASQTWYNSVYKAELASLDFYGDARFKFVWVERQEYGYDASELESSESSE
ncbi:MAG: hypothetical protein AAGA91_16840 [Pseudomonadota bacterium]